LGRAASAGYARTALVAAVSLALLVGSWSAASGQESGSSTSTPFSNGTAKATGVVARVAPGVGALQLGISSGVAVSQIQNTVASSQAEALDLGLLGSTLTVSSCSLPAPLKPEQLPKPLTVDSRKGKISLRADEYPIAGTTLGAGQKSASAQPTPALSAADSTVVGSSIPGLLTIDAGHSTAVTQIVNGSAREAHATVKVDLDLAGILKLTGMTWDAVHRTGKDPKATASFDIGTGSILGVPIPLESLVEVEQQINQALAYTGITITFPKVERFTTPADLIRITPLRIVLQDSPAGKDVLGPVLNLTRAQREQLFDQLTATICPAAGALLVGDIGLDVASGTGFIAVEIGGAEATTGQLTLSNPFGSDGTPPAVQALPSVPIPGTLPSFVSGVPPVGPVAGAQRTASVGPLKDICKSAHPRHHTPCSKGDALAVGLIGLVATAGVGALDWRHQRRRRRKQAAAAVAGAGA
jgi:hypothetical protein